MTHVLYTVVFIEVVITLGTTLVFFIVIINPDISICHNFGIHLLWRIMRGKNNIPVKSRHESHDFGNEIAVLR